MTLVHWFSRRIARLDPQEYFYWRFQRRILPLLARMRKGEDVSRYVPRFDHQVARLKKRGWYGSQGGWLGLFTLRMSP